MIKLVHLSCNLANQSGTAELCRMLNIASMSGSNAEVQDDLIIPHSVIIEASSGTKQYGRPLSLDQLFAGQICGYFRSNFFHKM